MITAFVKFLKHLEIPSVEKFLNEISYKLKGEIEFNHRYFILKPCIIPRITHPGLLLPLSWLQSELVRQVSKSLKN